jgi:hypothetical protein
LQKGHVVRDFSMTIGGQGVPATASFDVDNPATAEVIASVPECSAGQLDQARPRPLDPSRPALDLLEDLPSGIRGCRLVFLEYARDLAPGDEEGAGRQR